MRFHCCVQMITLLFSIYIIKVLVDILANDLLQDIYTTPNVIDKSLLHILLGNVIIII